MNKEKNHRLFLELYSKSQPRLYSFILMLVHSNHDADEIFQETSSLLWEKFDHYEEGTNFGAWATAIAKLKVLEYLRHYKDPKHHFNVQLIQNIAAVAESESEKVNERLTLLRGCLFKLDRMNRSLLSLRYQKNISVKEMAQRKGVSTGVMYRKLTKILNALRKCIHLSMVRQP